MKRQHRTHFRALAAAMALVSVTAISPVRGDPADIFSSGAPVIGSAPPKAADIRVGDASVSPTGAFQYSYPIAVPPGRGIQPSLALTYSSQAPIYGGIAAGWSLGSLPLITLDTSDGRLKGSSDDKHYTSTLAGGRPFIPVSETAASDVAATYRAQNDSSWARYERLNPGSSAEWRARMPDGRTLYFGDSDHVGGCSEVSDEYAPLTREIDRFGNAVEYFYSAAEENECLIHHITWGQNANAGITNFAAAYFDFAQSPPCSGLPIGGAVSWRTGTKMGTGMRRLASITLAAFPPGAPGPGQIIPTTPDHKRVISLEYDPGTENCSGNHAPFRSLVSIQETASGIDSPAVTLPAVKFTYGESSIGEGSLAWGAPVQDAPPWAGGNSLPIFESPLGTLDDNLGWGYRFADGRRWPTVEAMMIDLDGDGLIDRLTNNPELSGGNVVRCRASWQRNLGGLEFAAPQNIAMPTLKWKSVQTDDSSPDYYIGGPYANADTSLLNDDADEGCSLNYQITAYRNSHGSAGFQCYPGGTNCPAGGPHPFTCPSSHEDCSAKIGSPTRSILAFRWMDIDHDGRVDLVASPATGGQALYDFQHGNLPAAPDETPDIFGTFPECPDTTYTAFPGATPYPITEPPGDPRMPYTMCGGMFPWFVYKNKGDGVFGDLQGTPSPLPDEILYQPVPLETTQGDSSMTSSVVGQYQGTLDLDGDGFTDAIRAHSNGTDPWSVYLGDRDGVFAPANNGSAYDFAVSQGRYLNLMTYAAFGDPITQQEGLLDVNGDGLVDHWRMSAGTPVVSPNDSIGFGPPDATLAFRPSSDGLPGGMTYLSSNWPDEGYRSDSSRPFDLDLDGRVDILRDPSGGASPLQTYFNTGGQFTPTGRLIGDADSVGHHLVASYRLPAYWNGGPNPAYSWEIRSDLLDIDGDGIPEQLDFGQDPGVPHDLYLRRIPTPDEPPRLLVSIDNQRGAKTDVHYAPATDQDVVVQDGQNGKTMPQIQWVVRSQTTTDTLDNPNTTDTTSYTYINPEFSPDEKGHYSFRGFDQIETTLPSGAMREDEYEFDLDLTGRLTRTLIHEDSNDPSTVHSISETSWDDFLLFQDAIVTYHPIKRASWACSNGQTETQCLASPAGYTESTSELEPLYGPDGPCMWIEHAATTRAGKTEADGDRATVTAYDESIDATHYRVVPRMTKKLIRSAGTMNVYGQTRTRWDSLLLVPEYEDVWFDTNGDMNACAPNQDNCATTRRSYDMTTGNVVETTKPVQYSAGTASTTLTYDARKLFVATEINELGHQRDYAYEYGTGTRLLTRGPNAAGCSLTSSCPPNSPEKEEHRIRVDGLGRTIERYETFSDTGDSYQTFLVEKNAYVDSPAASVTHESAIDHDALTLTVRYSREKTDLDGHGRPIRTTSSAFGTAPFDAVTTYVYANDGTLAEVHVPDPTKNDASTVTYSYAFDSLGRPTSIRRPDSATPANRSGVDITYDGLSQTTAEVVTDPGAHPAQTRTTNDAFGRLVTVEELIALGTWSTTEYRYDPADNVEEIVDPEGVTTELVHDFAGRRTQILRAGGLWEYGYDKNGNLWWRTIPCEENPTTCAADYVSYFYYDDLDRVVSRNNAPAGLDSADQEYFGTTEYLTYDSGPNALGQLTGWELFGQGVSVNRASFAYNAQGQRTQTEQVTKAAGFDELTRQFEQSYWLSGAVAGTYYRDVVGTANCTDGSYSQTNYDARGMLANVLLDPCANEGTNVTRIRNTRNVSGLVTKRDETDASPGFHFESLWTYDTLGRVTGQNVRDSVSLDPVVRQDLVYYGNDDPKTLVHYLGANARTFVFGYDYRHQLQTVDVPADPSYFQAEYNYGPAGRFDTAFEDSSLPNGSEVRPRDVEYHYDGVDPEEVTSLRDNSGSVLRSYEYDLAGNQTVSCEGELSDSTCLGTSLVYVYDGAGRLRRATKFDEQANVVGMEEYWYDEMGRRNLVLKSEDSSVKTELIWFIGDTEAHYDGDGNLIRAYGHITLGAPIARFDRNADDAAVIEYQFHGLANHTIAAVDQATGTINASFSYAPFGEIIEATDDGGPSDYGIADHRRRMNDKYVDEISDLSYYGFRYYDKMSMTWTQGDPLYRFSPESAWAEPRRGSLYTVNVNNPLRYADPDGLEGEDIVAFATALLEVGAAATITTSVVLGAGYALFAGPQKAQEIAEENDCGVAMYSYPGGVYWVLTPNVHNVGAFDIAKKAMDAAAAKPRPLLMGDKDRVTPPSWVVNAGHRPEAGETAQAFATKILDQKYGGGNWKKGGGSEYSQIVKWVNRVVRAGGAAAIAKEVNESDQDSSPAPADLDEDGHVSEDEESTFMRNIK